MEHWPENFHENLVPLPTNLSFPLILLKILQGFAKTFPTKMKPTKSPANEKQNEVRKVKNVGTRESKK